MKKIKKIFCLALLIIGAGSISSLPETAIAGGSGATGGATLAQQIINKGELVKQVNEAVTQTKQQLQMYANMLTNTMGLNVSEWKAAMNTIMEMKNLYNSAEGLAYGIYGDMTNYVTNWENLFPDSSKQSEVKISEIKDRDGKICEDIIGITGKAAKQAGVTKQDLANDSALLQTLVEKGKTAQGQQQALQTAIQVGAMTTEQLIKLRGEYQNAQLIIQKEAAAKAQQQTDYESEGKKAMGTRPGVRSRKIKTRN